MLDWYEISWIGLPLFVIGAYGIGHLYLELLLRIFRMLSSDSLKGLLLCFLDIVFVASFGTLE